MPEIADPKARWREVTGTVLRSEVKLDGEDYRSVVEYQYEVDGTSYRGDTVFLGPSVRFSWKGPARRLVERFPAGATVTVYVDPANPQRATLHPHVDRNLPWLTMVILGLLIVGFVLRACGTH